MSVRNYIKTDISQTKNHVTKGMKWWEKCEDPFACLLLPNYKVWLYQQAITH